MNIKVLLLIVLFAIPIFSQQDTSCAEVTKRLAAASKKLNDWPELSCYKEANEKVAPPQKGETRVVFMGDSITDLWDNDGFGGFFPGKPYLDRGIGGQTTPQMLLRFRQDVVDLKPRVVIILCRNQRYFGKYRADDAPADRRQYRLDGRDRGSKRYPGGSFRRLCR